MCPWRTSCSGRTPPFIHPHPQNIPVPWYTQKRCRLPPHVLLKAVGSDRLVQKARPRRHTFRRSRRSAPSSGASTRGDLRTLWTRAPRFTFSPFGNISPLFGQGCVERTAWTEACAHESNFTYPRRKKVPPQRASCAFDPGLGQLIFFKPHEGCGVAVRESSLMRGSETSFWPRASFLRTRRRHTQPLLAPPRALCHAVWKGFARGSSAVRE